MKIEVHFERVVNPSIYEVGEDAVTLYLNDIKAGMVAEFIGKYPDVTWFDILFKTVDVSGKVERVVMIARAERVADGEAKAN